MKKSIRVGAYGWRHERWFSTFYPDDIPLGEKDEDWLLTYYSNEFDAVLVPAAYWCAEEKVNCESWLDDVHEDFQFYVECHCQIFEWLSMSDWVKNVIQLKPQLRGVVVLEGAGELDMDLLSRLLDLSHITLLSEGSNNIWRQNDRKFSCFSIIENTLSDLRLAREVVEDFVGSSGAESPATIIIDDAELRASDLAKFRSMLEIMGH